MGVQGAEPPKMAVSGPGSTNQSGAGDHSNGGSGPDLTLSTGPARPMGSFTPPLAKLRGGFRYCPGLRGV